MSIFANISAFVSEYAGLLKFCILLLLIGWATQAYIPVVEGIKKDDKVDWKSQKYVTSQLRKLSIQIEKEAFKKGVRYSPQCYFADLKKMDEKRIELNEKFGTRLHYLVTTTTNGIFHENIRNGRYTTQEASTCSDQHDEWRIKYDPLRKKEGSFGREDAFRALEWVWVLYMRGILLVLLLYLISMHAGRGIAQTILADKKRFILAVIAWPLLITRYPANVVREIIVEAELRRLGGAFRRLSNAEKQLVKTVANGIGYREWIVSFRAMHAVQFQRSLLCAVVLVIVMHMMEPGQSHAGQIDSVRAGPVISVQIDVDSHGWHMGATAESKGIPKDLFVCAPQPSEIEKFRDSEMNWEGIPERVIDHVPLRAVWCYCEV